MALPALQGTHPFPLRFWETGLCLRQPHSTVPSARSPGALAGRHPVWYGPGGGGTWTSFSSSLKQRTLGSHLGNRLLPTSPDP